MNPKKEKIQFFPIWDYKYAKWFQEVKYNGKTLTRKERKEFISIIDETIEQYSEGLSLLHNTIENNKNKKDEFHELESVIVSIWIFVQITMIDSMVISKYFIMSNRDYDRRVMRGKLIVILNEGFKKLYGFDEKTYKKSEWKKLIPLMKHFPEIINNQYQELTSHLKKHAKSSSWWKEERNLETHLEAEKLYNSRMEEIIESKVMMDSMKLFNTLQAVNLFLGNIHTCLLNFLVNKYLQNEIAE